MKEVFISYSTLDTVSAETVRNVLEKNGLSCWMAPRDIPGGSNYTKEIPIAIRNCSVFVLILSQNAQSSHWVLRELDSAVNSGKVILPFMLEDCILNDEFNFLLTGAQRYAAYQKKAEVLENLIRRIRFVIDSDSAPESAAPAEPISPPPAPEKSEPKQTPILYLGEVKCVSCGSMDLTAKPKRLKRHGVKELATMLLIPLLAAIAFFVVFLTCAFFVPYDRIGLSALISLVCMIAGGFWGDHLSKTMVKRMRIRNGIHSVCYRCKRCSKLFRHDEPLQN